jgi:hypothetical protein
MLRELLSTKFRLLSLAGLAVAFVASGCGSSGSDTTALSKAEVIARADRICSETKQKTQEGFVAYSEQNKVPKSGAGMSAMAADFVNTVFVPIYKSQIAQIEALRGPAADRKEAAEIIAAMRRGLSAGQRQPVAFIRGAPFFHEASTLAVAYGLKSCTG